MFRRRRPAADGGDAAAPGVRIVGMTAEHALACLNAYRKLVPIDRWPAAVQQADAAQRAATDERLRRKMEVLRAAQLSMRGGEDGDEA